MQRVTPDRSWLLFDVAATRALEASAASQLPAHTLMQRAGLAVARLALAVAPHARVIWVACGPGNNGGDGFEAAMHLKQWGKEPVVTWLGRDSADGPDARASLAAPDARTSLAPSDARTSLAPSDARTSLAPSDARASLARARAAGIEIAAGRPAQWDLAIDALLGIGVARTPEGELLAAITAMNEAARPVLSVDIPSGLSADTGQGTCVRATHTLSLLGLKPGLFTGSGRDATGSVWVDELGITPSADRASAVLRGPPDARGRKHASHKGSYGDVAVIGGAAGMAGAALLAGSAALHHGAGRVFVSALDERFVPPDVAQPELMFRNWTSLDVAAMAVACGCGGGDAVRGALPKLLSSARSLVVDADALNAIAADPQLQTLLEARGRRGQPTVLTPHPLEAARLIPASTAQVQADRIGSAQALADRYRCIVVLKGSGSVICGPARVPAINPTGNALLATAGTGDVLAGMIAARLAHSEDAFDAACNAVWLHGAAADSWPRRQPLTASALARASSQP